MDTVVTRIVKPRARARRDFRRFHLVRDEDVSTVSGTGVVAEGVQFSNQKVALNWTTRYTSTTVFDSLAVMVAIHGHEGRTRVEWIDD